MTYESPAWWCADCFSPHYTGTSADRCPDCGFQAHP